MLKGITVKNFKSLKNISFNPASLNVLMGLNGAGKSSLIQIFLLLKQQFTESCQNPYLNLNGDYVSLGTLKDILYCYGENENIQFTFLGDSNLNKQFSLEIPTKDVDLESDSVHFDLGSSDKSQEDCRQFQDYFGWFRKIQYISANRLGPQQEHVFYTSKIKEKKWGIYGENAVQYLAEYWDYPVSERMCFPSSNDQTLQAQVNEWMSVISPGTNIHAEKKTNISKALLSISFAKGIGQNNFRPQNVGFGISYALSIVIMLLAAKPGDCLIIENPEAHIHPKGQAELGKLIALCASAGVQIFVETHSDHIVNGIRVAVTKEQVTKDNVSFVFFDRCDSDTGNIYEQYTEIKTIKIDSYGEFDDYPDGFMDEWNKQLREIIGNNEYIL